MLTDLFWKKLILEMRLLHVIEHRPGNRIKLDPLTEEVFSISKEVVREWSEDNLLLYEQILQNGMAEFICNKDYLFEFYRSIRFEGQRLKEIDPATLRFTNLRTLSLVQNNIASVRHIPPSCRELYLDLNCLHSVDLPAAHPLQLLSASHNHLDHSSLHLIAATFPELRCLNISYNQVSDLRQFLNAVGTLACLKILIAFHNPISLLPIYYSYLTDHLHLSHFDGSKYVKEEPRVEEPPKEKEEVKEEKKDGKKDNKKGAKVEEKKAEEPPKVEEPPKPVPRELTEEDFQKIKLSVRITNLEQHKGSVLDAALFPGETDPQKMQTCYWVRYELMGETGEERGQMAGFDSTTTENGESRLNLRFNLSKECSITPANYLSFNRGLKVQVMQREPQMVKDPETGEQRPEISNNEVVMTETVLGAAHVDFRLFHLMKEKALRRKFRLFPAEAVDSPLFYDPFEDEQQLVAKQKQSFEQHLKALEEEALKKVQEEEQALSQKKGKDSKKGGEKKGGKKEGKETGGEKTRSEACSYPVSERQYVVSENEKMFKGRELLCVEVVVE